MFREGSWLDAETCTKCLTFLIFNNFITFKELVFSWRANSVPKIHDTNQTLRERVTGNLDEPKRCDGNRGTFLEPPLLPAEDTSNSAKPRRPVAPHPLGRFLRQWRVIASDSPDAGFRQKQELLFGGGTSGPTALEL